jgi:hypothetical protein
MFNASVLFGVVVAVSANTATTIGADWLSADKCPLVVNEDNDHFFKLPASWMTREGLVRYLDDVLQGPVTHFVMCVNGQRASYDSKTWEPIWKGVDEPARTDTATAMDGTHDRWAVNAWELFKQGIDPYSVWIQRCREKGVSPWVSIRMNDVHWVTVSNYFRNATFCRTRRDLWRNQDAKGDWNDYCLDYRHQEVRDYTFAQVAEMLERWDMDGIELDWMRSPLQFRKGHERSDAHFLTEFMRRVRRQVQEVSKKRGRKIRIAVRLPRSPQLAEKAGYDADVWLREGLMDLIVGSSVFWPDPELPVATWLAFIEKHNPSVRFLPSIDCFQLPDVAHFRGMASCYYRWGAKGLYLFNAPYCGKYDTDGRHHDEDTFGIVCREGLSPDSIRGKPMKVPPPRVDFPILCD